MESCGAELAQDAGVPEQLAELMDHVADNMVAHARWVGTATFEAAQEHQWLLKVAEDYRSISAAALRAATTMRSMQNLAAAPHDPSRWGKDAFAKWMSKRFAEGAQLRCNCFGVDSRRPLQAFPHARASAACLRRVETEICHEHG
jgi:hypothetical protein